MEEDSSGDPGGVPMQSFLGRASPQNPSCILKAGFISLISEHRFTFVGSCTFREPYSCTKVFSFEIFLINNLLRLWDMVYKKLKSQSMRKTFLSVWLRVIERMLEEGKQCPYKDKVVTASFLFENNAPRLWMIERITIE